MNSSPSARRWAARIVGWGAPLGVAFGLYRAYQWAEPTRTLPTLAHPVASTVTVRMEKVPFTQYFQGRKTWSLWAERIDLEHPPGMGIGNIQSATLTDIRDGALYKLPEGNFPLAAQSTANRSPADKPVARFHAREGRYTLGALEVAPLDLSLTYNIQWQFRLTGGVFDSAAGEHLESESLRMLEMVNRRTGKPERRIVCDQGAIASLKDVRVTMNQARYDPIAREVACLGGIRGVFRGGVVQAERVFWALGAQTLRCPESASGEVRAMPFTADGLVVDLKRKILRANHARLEIRMEDVADIAR